MISIWRHTDDDNRASAGETIFTPGTITRVAPLPKYGVPPHPSPAFAAYRRAPREVAGRKGVVPPASATFEEPFSERGTELSAKHKSSEHRKPYFIAF